MSIIMTIISGLQSRNVSGSVCIIVVIIVVIIIAKHHIPIIYSDYRHNMKQIIKINSLLLVTMPMDTAIQSSLINLLTVRC